MVDYYPHRSLVAEFFRLFRSGYRDDMFPVRTARRLQGAIAISAVTGWRIMPMTRLGHQVPICGARLTGSEHGLLFLHHPADSSRRRGGFTEVS